ncbi:MAG: hypothetical protein ACFHX7_01280 [Pseudomonadota bacterium]
MPKRLIKVLLLTLLTGPVSGAEDSRILPLLIPAEILENFAAGDIAGYRCPADVSCRASCEAGPNAMKFDYADVQRLEISRAETHWLLALRLTGRNVLDMAPVPVGCHLEGLVLERMTPASDVQVVRPIDARDIIFEIQPQ